jgi:hypothetical protein
MKEKILNLIKKGCKLGDNEFIDIGISLVPEESREQASKICNKIFKLIPEDGGEPDDDLLSILEDLLVDKKVYHEMRVETDEVDTDYYANDFNDPIRTRESRSVVSENRPNMFNPKDYNSIGRDEDHQKYKAESKPIKKPKAKNVKVECTDCGSPFEIPQELYIGEDYGTKCNDCLG